MPFVPGALERNTLWLAPEQVGERSVADLVELVKRYQRLLEKRRQPSVTRRSTSRSSSSSPTCPKIGPANSSAKSSNSSRFPRIPTTGS